MMENLPEPFIAELQHDLQAEIRTDFTSRLLYSTDASIYQIQPLGIVFPRSIEELQSIIASAAKYNVPILPRGSGSSMAGQAIGKALILDVSRYLNRLLEIDPETQTALVEPGLILTELNKAAKAYGLTFGPDPASAERATLGGSLANNATGAHSILYGMAGDHLLAAETFLADGSSAVFEPITLARAVQISQGDSLEARLYQAALEIRTQKADLIRSRWPKVWRRASGYNLNTLLPWSPSEPPLWSAWQPGEALTYPPVPTGSLNLAPLLAGSEGTLGIFSRLKLRLVPLTRKTILGVLIYPSIAEACDAAPGLLELNPTAVELVPGDLIRLARSVPAYARQLTFIQGNPEAMLIVEFSGENQAHLRQQVTQLGPQVLIAEDPEEQNKIWNVRKMGMGILSARPGDIKAVTFIEDMAVPVESLGRFVRELETIFQAHGVHANYYAHASAGCLHIRPLMDLKTAQGKANLRSIAMQAVKLALSLGGVPSGEHGDGILRSEWLENTFSPDVVDLFRQIKTAADPNGLLNPGKIINPPPMDTQLRYDEDYRTHPWKTVLDFSRQGGLAGAIEMCTGVGVCRKKDGVMCPSFQASQDEMYTTRGRANLLRALISGKFPSERLGQEAVRQTLDLCLACKGCKAECPTGTDVAKLKYAFTDEYYRTHRRKLRDYLFGYIDRIAPLGSLFAPLVNPVLHSPLGRGLSERFLALSAQRDFPTFASAGRIAHPGKTARPDILFLTDAFSRYFHPETEAAGCRALEAAGYRVQVIPVIGAGRTLISKGFLEPAKKHAERLVQAIKELDPEGKLPVVGVEPSEIYTLKDEYLDLLPQDAFAAALARRAWMVDEFLIRPEKDGSIPIKRLVQEPPNQGKVLLHGHCYQKARPPADDGFPVGAQATKSMLEAAGYQVEMIDAGCCGMAGAFGYEKEHAEFSLKVGELKLFPAVRSSASETNVVAAGTSCRSQIEDGTERAAVHPIVLLVGGLNDV